MKKKYIIPVTSIMQAEVEEILATSTGVISNDNGIGYGGIDDDGGQTPSAKEFDFEWDF